MQRPSDRWISIALSLLLHAALVGLLVYGWLLFRQPPRPAPTLAIEATVVDARTLKGAQRPPEPPPPVAPAAEAPPDADGPPPPTPEELAQREAQRQQAEAAAAQQQRAAEERSQQEKAAQARQLEEARQAEAQKKLEEQRRAEARAAQEKKAREAAEAKQRAAEAQEASEREADLKRSLAAEEHAVRAGPALANWQSQIAAKINRAWLRPPTAKAGIECVLNVTQVPGGEVTQVSIGECNGDQAVRESIEAAVYRASPLPPPPDPALFDRNLKINFKPD